LMSTYGRALSKELLSRWSYEGEENVLHGAIKGENTLSWINGSREVGFNIGGDVRSIQTYRNTPAVEEGKFFPMQREVEAAFRFYQVTLVSTAGWVYSPGEDEFDTRRAYVMWQPNDKYVLRAGRFMPTYGIMIPDHYAAIKRGLRFDQGFERDTVELNYISEKWNVVLSYSESPESTLLSQEEKGGSAQVTYALFDKHKVGASYWYGEFDNRKRAIAGLHGILGFTEHLYALSEVDYEMRHDVGGKAEGIFYFQKLGWEFTRGVHAIAQIDGSQSNLDVNNTTTFAYGLGMNFYPRPHFEIQGLWTRATVKSVSSEEMDIAHLVLHYYF